MKKDKGPNIMRDHMEQNSSDLTQTGSNHDE